MNKTLYIVIPCFNEQEVLQETAKKVREKMLLLMEKKKIEKDSKIVFINDGSGDMTWDIIAKLHKEDSIFRGINLSCNKGHQNALLAGLLTVKDEAGMTISMDADLQDDIDVIEEMVDKYAQGKDIIYGVRDSRKSDTFFKRITAESFYKVMNTMGANTIYNHADYRLMSKRALDSLSRFKEVNLFLRGIVPMIGYESDIVYYERKERYAGVSKYPLKKMFAFAWEGVTSLSIKPIRFICGLGVFVFIVSIGIILYSLIRHYTGNTVIGWTTTVASIWAIGGLILLSIGIVGEYVGKVYLETKERPRYIIETYLSEDDDKDGKNSTLFQ